MRSADNGTKPGSGDTSSFCADETRAGKIGTSATVLSFANAGNRGPELSAHHWRAYVHPKAVKLFERQWLVNLILWGNYERLRDATLAEMEEPCSADARCRWRVSMVT